MSEHDLVGDTGDAEHVLVTTPQGTQEAGVEHGHEKRDVHLVALLKWVAGLFTVVILTQILLAVAYLGLKRMTTPDATELSPWAMITHPVPGPRLLPNPDQTQPMLPAASLSQLHRHENVGLREYGLVDQAGQPVIPDSAVNMIGLEQGPASPAPDLDPEGLPQSSSGGRTTGGVQ